MIPIFLKSKEACLRHNRRIFYEQVCFVSTTNRNRKEISTTNSILESFTRIITLKSTIFSGGYYSPRSEEKENRISLKLPVDSVVILNSGCSRGFPRYSVFVSLPFEAHSTWPSYAFLFPGLRTDLRSF